jgi:predicted HTH domain antitoxin
MPGRPIYTSINARTSPGETYGYIIHIANAMPTISTRVPDDLEAELEEYLESERLDRSTAVRKLLSEGLDEWRRERALDRFADGEVSFAKAAELADLSVWEFARLVEESDRPWVSDDHLEADLDDL